MKKIIPLLLLLLPTTLTAEPTDYRNPQVAYDFAESLENPEARNNEIAEIRRSISAEPYRQRFTSEHFLRAEHCPAWANANEEQRLQLASEILVETLIAEANNLQQDGYGGVAPVLYPYFVRDPNRTPEGILQFESTTPCGLRGRPQPMTMRSCFIDMMSRYHYGRENQKRSPDNRVSAYDRSLNQGFYVTTRQGTRANTAMIEKIQSLSGCTIEADTPGGTPSPDGVTNEADGGTG